MSLQEKYPRGSIWRIWDLHIHSPASFHWDGERFGKDEARNTALVDEMIAALNDAEPIAFALMDYWTFDGWFALKKRLAEQGAPILKKMVFPGIELRLVAPMPARLNAHVVFADTINDQYLKDFLSHLRLEFIDQPLSSNALIEYARNANSDKLKKHGYEKADVTNNAAIALEAGCKIAEIKCDSYKKAISLVPNELAVGFMPWSTNDGLNQINWVEHYAYALGLFEASPIFETRNVDQWAAFVGIETEGNKSWLPNFQTALKNIPRLAVSGSDSHKFKGTPGNADKRGYGDFPSGKKTWIKADPTWKGLLQTLKEPAKRSFLGDIPPKLELVRQNKTFYIDAVRVSKVPGCALPENWLDGCDIPLNADLVAIIGNKGSGKSALADIVALLGNSQQRSYFSFLKKDRFRGKVGEPARQFKGELKWLAGDPGEMLLCDDPAADKVELVRYIPQGRFEALCNDHVSGRSDAFERELRNVIFSHVDSSVRLGALDFDQLIEQQEDNFRAKLSELRKILRSLNEQIVSIEDQLHPNVKKTLEEQARLKNGQLAEHLAIKPKEELPPTEALTDDQQQASARLAKIEVELRALEDTKKAQQASSQLLARKLRAVRNINERLSILEGQYSEFKIATAPELVVAQLSLEDVVSFGAKRQKLEELSATIAAQEATQVQQVVANTTAHTSLEAEKVLLGAALNEPQQRYQKYVSDLKLWQTMLEAIEGNETEPESKKGVEARLSQIQQLPESLIKRKSERLDITSRIYGVLTEQRAARAELFSPLQALIQGNALIRDAYKLQFQSNLQGSADTIAANLFGAVKQNAGELRGEDESFAAVRTRFEKYQFKVATDAASFASDLAALFDDAAQKTQSGVAGIRAILRKGKEPVDVYDYVYGLQCIEPKYTLLFQETEIEQLSPGQRGALLLIFYLLVDKGRNPIVLDQPEENLDNETVVSLLAPVLNEAKKSRQIIMVTHNPNLAVYCDSEQIIHATFDRKNGSKIEYRSGSIEDGVINRAAVDVLEGTKKAFNNRGEKYH